MNEKFNELSALAQEKLIDPITGEEYYSFSRMKFAELIVKECINSCENHNLESFGILPVRAHMVTKSCQNNIKQHFGVKENERED